MAEGVIGALLGGEAEEAAEGPEAPTVVDVGLDPAAAALAMGAARSDPELAAEATRYFRRQAQLVDEQKRLVQIQTEHLHEQREVVLANLKLRGHGERLKLASHLFFALVATLLGVGAVVMLGDAVTARSVIVDAFKAPAALAGRGLTGDVVAGGLLDELIRLQAATHSAAAKRQLANDWTGDIKVEIPETGISISEVERLLHKRFGHDLHIGGDLVQTRDGGLALSVRGDGVLPKVFTGGAGDLEKLTTRAVEYVYGESQPGLFVRYLDDTSRDDEAIAFAKAHLARASLTDQPYLLNYWADAVAFKGGPQATAQALPLWREAVRIQPEFWPGYNNIMYGLGGLGDEEGMVQVGRQMIRAAGGRPGKAPELQYANYDQVIYDLQTYRAESLVDATSASIFTSTATGATMLTIAQADALLHEPDTARLRIATAVWDPKSHGDAGAAAVAQAYLAEEVGDLPAAARARSATIAAYAAGHPLLGPPDSHPGPREDPVRTASAGVPAPDPIT